MNENIDEESLFQSIQDMTWIEAIENIWLVQTAQILPEELHLTLIDLVTTCKGLIETGIAMQELMKKLYGTHNGDKNITHRIAIDESDGFLSKNEALLLDKIYRNEIFEFFTRPLSSIDNDDMKGG